MEITPPPTPCAERILGLAEELRAVRVDGPIQLLFKLTLLCLCMSLGLRMAMYERGLPAGRKSAADRRVATPALRRTAVGAPREIRDREPGFDAAVPAGAGEATEVAAAATEVAAEAVEDREGGSVAWCRTNPAGWRPLVIRRGRSPGSASKRAEPAPSPHAHFVTMT